jgi:hypothetical protein
VLLLLFILHHAGFLGDISCKLIPEEREEFKSEELLNSE